MKTKQLFLEVAPDYSPRNDPWGNAIGAFFSVADVLYFEHGAEIPAAWGYRPSPIATEPDPEDYGARVLVELAPTEAELIRLGHFLHRLTGRLDRHGRSY